MSGSSGHRPAVSCRCVAACWKRRWGSSSALGGDTLHFSFDNMMFKIEKGDEPRMTGGYTLANSVADALVLQCYESESMTA